ncbi:MAG: ribosome small subunit-dependent GTPase A [Gammaproteobacteria bacterium]|nr:ribosome small subunit-dependent GTPase A [Gammaproteobacteria bacterium]
MRGRVIVNFRRHVIVEDEQGIEHQCLVKGRKLKPVSGDIVEFELTEQDEGVIESIHERRNEIRRYDSLKKHSTLAANVDTMIIVHALEPMIETFSVDKYLVAAEASDAEPIIVINKIDMADDVVRPWILELCEEYADIGYKVLPMSAEQGDGIDLLRDALRGHTGILVGPSGVGKSSIAGALLPERDIEVGEISTARNEGRHTTTRTTLYHLPSTNGEGGDLIDSPGVREFRLWPMPVRELAECFPEFLARRDGCRFTDCVHRNEPHCAIRKAVEAEEILLRRYEAYLGMAEIMDRQYSSY